MRHRTRTRLRYRCHHAEMHGRNVAGRNIIRNFVSANDNHMTHLSTDDAYERR